MDTPPATSIEVVEFRPIYVVGAVNSPGEFRYRPQMTVLQAIGMAGGHYREENALIGSEREVLSAVRDYEVLKLRRWSLIARLARLKAELAGAKEIKMPEELTNSPKAADLLRSETAILAARQEAVESKKLAIKDLRKLLEATIKKQNQEIRLRASQLKIAREEFKKVQSLVKRGLAVSSRESDFSRQVTELEAKQLQLEVTKLDAELQLNKAARDELDLVNENLQAIVSETQQAREELGQVEVQLQAAKSLVLEAVSLGGRQTPLQVDTRHTYRLTRSTDGQTETLTVGDQYLIRPGDTLQVIAPEIEPDLTSGGSLDLPG